MSSGDRFYPLTVAHYDGTPVYTVDLPSVTTVLDKVTATHGLETWYYNQAIGGVSILLEKYGADMPSDIPSIHSLLAQHSLSPQSRRDAAADKGTTLHAQLEKLALGKKVKESPEIAPLLAWWDERGLTEKHVHLTEKVVCSLKYKYAGTLDLALKMGGKLWVVDLKTGKSLYPKYKLQVEAYALAYEEMTGEQVDKLGVLHLNDGKCRLVEYERCTDAWLAAVSLYYQLGSLKRGKEDKNG
jgi:CRISPR/Cas system-associated exonuclease Cas4 (RecB family)